MNPSVVLLLRSYARYNVSLNSWFVDKETELRGEGFAMPAHQFQYLFVFSALETIIVLEIARTLSSCLYKFLVKIKDKSRDHPFFQLEDLNIEEASQLVKS